MHDANLTELLSRHLAGASLAALPPAAVERSRYRLLDAVGLIAAGRRASGSPEAIELARAWGGRPDATLLTTGDRVPAMHAAFVSAMLMRGYDFEPVGADREDGAQVPAHITGTTVAVGLAVGERVGASGAELLAAVAFGDDLAARLAHATGFDVYGGGDNTGTVNVLGGAATAAILLGLDADGIRAALGVAVNQAAGTIDNVNDKTVAFKLPIALAARAAVLSAELAAVGFEGPRDPIGGRHGFLAQWTAAGEPDLDRLTAGLGERFFGDAVIKPWPACRASHPAIEAAERIVAESVLVPEDVVGCTVEVSPRAAAGFVGQPFEAGPSAEVSAAFSIQFGVATALLDGTVALRHLMPEHASGERLGRMLERVRIAPTLDSAGGLKARIVVETALGERLRAEVGEARGAFSASAEDRARVEGKFLETAAWGGLAPEVAERLREVVLGVAERETIDAIPELLRLG